MVIVIVLALALLMFFSMRGWSIFITAPICALLVAVSASANLLEAYTGTYMAGAGNYIIAWFPTFMLGALFGKVMEDSGAAYSLAKVIANAIGAKRAILAVIISTSILTYGGVSLFVVVFAVYPLAVALFKEADLPKRLIPACIATGAFSYTAIAIPGSPQLQNVIPTTYLGTTPMAAPVVGILCAAYILAISLIYLNRRAKQATTNGEHFVPGEKDMQFLAEENKKLPSPILSIIPLIVIVVVLNVLKQNIVIALSCGVLCCIILMFKHLTAIQKTINIGVQNTMLAILNTAFAVGFGSVVKAAPGFTQLVSGLEKLSLGNPLIYEYISVNALAGVTGSASGGLSIALEALGQQLLSTGINPEVLHRVAAISANGLDSLPHCGAVLTLLAICGVTHKESYRDIFLCTVIFTMSAGILAIILGSIGLV